MEMFLIYLWLKLDLLLFLVSFGSLVGIASFLVMGVVRTSDCWDINTTQNEARLIKLHKRVGVLTLVMGCGALLLPSSKEVAILVGSSVALDVAKSPEGTKIAALLRGKANELLDEEMNKLKKGNR